MPQSLNVVLIGNISSGKSTTLGHLLYKTGFIGADRIAKNEFEANKIEKGSHLYAWAVTNARVEQEKGITIDVVNWKLATSRYAFNMRDAPGCRKFARNTIVGICGADAAILVVGAGIGEFECGIQDDGGTLEHCLMAYHLGITQMIVVVNKMDDPSVNWNQARFDHIKERIQYHLARLGLRFSKIDFVPTSSLYGDNLLTPSSNMPWYTGATLIDAMDQFDEITRDAEKPLRIPIRKIYRIGGVGTVVTGIVAYGKLSPNDCGRFVPSGLQNRIRTIESHFVQLECGMPGDCIGWNIRNISSRDLRCGMVFADVRNPPKECKSFTAQITIINHRGFCDGYQPMVHCHTAATGCKIALISMCDPISGKPTGVTPKTVKTGDCVIVEVTPLKSLCVERFDEFPKLGRVILRDRCIVAAGVIKDMKLR